MAEVSTGILAILGIGVFGGVIGAAIFQRLQIPSVVGYIVIGLVIGEVGFGLVGAETLETLQPLNLFALGIIGFMVGGELKLDSFRQHGKQLFAILLFEGVGAFVLAGTLVGLLLYFLGAEPAVAVAGGVVFGAIASATDPASTISVLWECRSRGVLTTTIIAVVALDDALAMFLYAIGTTTAQILTGQSTSLAAELGGTAFHLFGAIGLGIIAGLVLRWIGERFRREEKIFATSVGILLFIIGVSAIYELDVILATMALGVTLVNTAPRQSETLFKSIRSFAEPIYIIFFVLVGARLDIAAMPGWLWGLVALYVAGRSVGKIAGAYAGGRLTNAAKPVQRYTGIGLFAQGGIAVGLSIMAAHLLGDIEAVPGMLLGDLIIFGVTASTFVLQVFGPPLIKLVSRLSGEMGRDVTEEDVMESWKVADVMTENIEAFKVNTPLSRVFEQFTQHDHLVYPVVDMSNRLRGLISLDSLKGIISSQETWDWVLAADVMGPVQNTATVETPLRDAADLMRRYHLEELAVLEAEDSEVVVGMLDERSLRIRVSEEALRRRSETEAA